MSEVSDLSDSPPPVIAPEEQPFVEFARTMHSVSPRLWVSKGIVAVCVGVFVLMWARGVSPWQPQVLDLIAWGANAPARTGTGEWWRLVTCLFLHVGLLHLAFNMWVLWDIGPLMEQLLGTVGFLLLYLVSGVCGSLASYCFMNPATASAGASGAIFGLYGGLLAFTLGQRRAIPWQIVSDLRNSSVAFVLFSLAATALLPNVDVAGHVGGLLGGILCGLVLRQRFSPEMVRGRWLRNVVCAVVVPAGLWGASAFLPAPPPDVAQLNVDMQQFPAALHDVRSDVQTGRITPEEGADQIERKILPRIRSIRGRLNRLDRLPDQRQLDAARRQFRRLEEAAELSLRWMREDDPELEQKSGKKLEDANAESL